MVTTSRSDSCIDYTIYGQFTLQTLLYDILKYWTIHSRHMYERTYSRTMLSLCLGTPVLRQKVATLNPATALPPWTASYLWPASHILNLGMSVWATFSLYQFQSWSLFSSLAWLIMPQRVWATQHYSFSAILLMVGCRDVRTWIWQETCRHLCISVKAGRLRPPRKTDHKCTWSAGMSNQHARIQSPFLLCVTYWTTWIWTSQFLFLLFWVATALLVAGVTCW